MPTAVQLWRLEDERPVRVPQHKLDLEARLQQWLRHDIGLVSDELLVIGEEVETAYGGFIDLLAMDGVGNLVILELKKDKTPRDIVAQVLDYASWVRGLNYQVVEQIANGFMEGKALGEAFRGKFGTDLPEVLNERHRMYIVASYLDPATQRIVEYLSEEHGVDINVATFAYFQTDTGEFLGRSLLLDESQVEERVERKSKRLPPRSWEELKQMAEERGVLGLYGKALDELGSVYDGKNRLRGGAYFTARAGGTGTKAAIVSVYLDRSSEERGLAVLLYLDRLRDWFSIPQQEFRGRFGPPAEDGSEWATWLFDGPGLDALIGILREAAARRMGGSSPPPV